MSPVCPALTCAPPPSLNSRHMCGFRSVMQQKQLCVLSGNSGIAVCYLKALRSAREGIGGMCLYAPTEMHSIQSNVFFWPERESGEEWG